MKNQSISPRSLWLVGSHNKRIKPTQIIIGENPTVWILFPISIPSPLLSRSRNYITLLLPENQLSHLQKK
jgi:hypothetical protein